MSEIKEKKKKRKKIITKPPAANYSNISIFFSGNTEPI